MRLPTLPSFPLLRKRFRLLSLLSPALLSLGVGCSMYESAGMAPLSPLFRGVAQAPDELPRVLPLTSPGSPKTLTLPSLLMQPKNNTQPISPGQPLEQTQPTTKEAQSAAARLGFSNTDL